MRLLPGFLRLPFPIFVLISAVAVTAIGVVTFAGVMTMSIWFSFAATGLLLLARDWSLKRRGADV